MRGTLLGSSGLLGLTSLWRFSVYFPLLACTATASVFPTPPARSLWSRMCPAGYLHRQGCRPALLLPPHPSSAGRQLILLLRR